MHISVLVEATARVIETVRHLVADHHTDGTIVEGIVGIHIEEGILQNTCGEADFVGGGVIVGIDGLWCHIPIIAINGFSNGMIETPGIPELAALLYIFVIRFGRINLKLRKVRPLIRVANLDIEGVQFQQGVDLRRVIHPVLGGDTLAKGNLEVLYQRDHTLLGGLREVFLRVDLTQRLTHHTLHLTGAALPERMVLLTTRTDTAVEVEALCDSRITQIVGCT